MTQLQRHIAASAHSVHAGQSGVCNTYVKACRCAEMEPMRQWPTRGAAARQKDERYKHPARTPAAA
jgi:hypothetical protein